MKSGSVIFTAVILSVIAAYGTVKLVTEKKDPVTKLESTYERVIRTGEMRCGYLPIKAVIYKDPNTGKLSGVGYDIVNIMATNLGLKVKWVGEASFVSMAEDLKHGRYDMICNPVMPSAKRSRALNFSRTLFMMPALVWLYKDNPHHDGDVSWLNNKKIKMSFVDGIVFQQIALREFPQVSFVNLPEMSNPIEQLVDVSTKKADATILLSFDGEGYIKSNGPVIKAASKKPIAQIFFGFPLPKEDYHFKTMIDTTLDEMVYNGTIDSILNKYDPDKKYYIHLRPIH